MLTEIPLLFFKIHLIVFKPLKSFLLTKLQFLQRPRKVLVAPSVQPWVPANYSSISSKLTRHLHFIQHGCGELKLSIFLCESVWKFPKCSSVLSVISVVPKEVEVMCFTRDIASTQSASSTEGVTSTLGVYHAHYLRNPGVYRPFVCLQTTAFCVGRLYVFWVLLCHLIIILLFSS